MTSLGPERQELNGPSTGSSEESDTNLANCCRGMSAVFEVIRRLNMGRKDVMWGTSKARKLWSDDEVRDRTAGPGPRPGSLGRGEPSWADYFMTLDTDLHNGYIHRHVIFSLWILEKRINLSLSKPELRESDSSWAGAMEPLDSPTQWSTSQSTVYRGQGQRTSSWRGQAALCPLPGLSRGVKDDKPQPKSLHVGL